MTTISLKNQCHILNCSTLDAKEDEPFGDDELFLDFQLTVGMSITEPNMMCLRTCVHPNLCKLIPTLEKKNTWHN